jgi:DNA-directed RNA polymerase subunit RPC12/RpoP
MSPTAFLFLQLAIVFFVWLVCGWVAQAVAPDRHTTFFWVTFLILGPLGVAAALIAQPDQTLTRRPVAAGRRRFICPRCGAGNDIPENDESYNCWRCSERRKVEPPKKPTPSAKKG